MTQIDESNFSSSRRSFLKRGGSAVLSLALPFGLGSPLNLLNMVNTKHFDVIIVGGSYSGLAAGMALGRALRKVLIIDGGNPCNKQTPHSHNFLTQDGRTPKEISGAAKEQVSKYPTVEFLSTVAVKGAKVQNGFEIEVASGAVYTATKVLFAAGIKDVMPPIPGFAECWGISVLHCPYCHGYEVKNRKTGILANGDAAYEMATLISNWTSDLTIYTNGPSALTEAQASKINEHRIRIVESELRAVQHTNGQIERLEFKDGTYETPNALYSRLPFVQHCTIPQLMGCELTKEGYIKIDAAQQTTVPGLHASGDSTTRMRTVANAVSTGTIAGMMINKQLIEEKF